MNVPGGTAQATARTVPPTNIAHRNGADAPTAEPVRPFR